MHDIFLEALSGYSVHNRIKFCENINLVYKHEILFILILLSSLKIYGSVLKIFINIKFIGVVFEDGIFLLCSLGGLAPLPKPGHSLCCPSSLVQTLLFFSVW